MSKTELAIDPQVREAAAAFAQVLSNTREFWAFEESYQAFKHDRTAQEAVRLFEEKQRALQLLQRSGPIPESEQDELQRLRAKMLGDPKVSVYIEAQDELMVVCQAAVAEISDAIGMDFAGACAPSCCG